VMGPDRILVGLGEDRANQGGQDPFRDGRPRNNVVPAVAATTKA
jgi:hypothetical protein